MKAWLAKRSDRTLALLCAAAVFVLVAWPLLLVEVPPYQDVANHLAVSTVADHPADYPEFVFTGYWKTNAAFFAWEHFVGHAVGALVAIRLFSALVLAASALAFTRLLLVLRGRDELLVGTLFLAPMVHSFCICLGLLDFSLGFALAVWLLAQMIEQQRAPTATRAAGIALTSVAIWYAHPIPLFLAGVLVLVEIAVTAFRSRDEAKRTFVWCGLPATAGALLMAWSVLGQLLGPATVHLRSYPSIWLAPWDLVQNLWVQYFLAFTPRSASSIVPCVALAVIAWRARRERHAFFGPAAFGVLAALYATVPYVLSFWAFANTRVEPFLWTAALVRVPSRVPRWLARALAFAALAYSISLGVDFVRLDRDRREFVAGIPAVPEHAKLLPLIFDTKGASVSTRPLSHTWGYYVEAKQVAAPRLFATSRMFGVAYREAPDPQLEQVALEHFTGAMRDPTAFCDLLEGAGIHASDCTQRWRDAWADFWKDVEPKFDWLLLWDTPAVTMTVIPPEYREVFARGHLRIMHRP
ncbi:MAG TPA: hypothetical protein VGH28_30685 [Polyangiaceae bacterium]